MMNKVIRLFLLVVAIGLLINCQHLKAQQNPKPADLIEFEDPQSLAISPDGSKVLVRTRRAQVDSNQFVSSVWQISINGENSQSKLDIPEEAQNLEWFPDSERIAYLAPSNEGRQVWTKKIGADTERQITRKTGNILSFSLSPNGSRIAFTTREYKNNSQENDEDKSFGVEVDLESFWAKDLFGDQLIPEAPPQKQLWIRDLNNKTSRLIGDTLTVDLFRWSPSGTKIALVAKPTSILRAGVPTRRSDIYIHDFSKDQLYTVKKGVQGPGMYEGTITYTGPFWSPSGDRLGFAQIDRNDRWASMPNIGIYNIKTQKSRYIVRSEDQELEAPRFHWLEPDSIWVEYTERARNGLFKIAVNDGSVTPVRVTDKHISKFNFSDDSQQAVWVKQSVEAPPEVYAAQKPFNSPKKISNFNNTDHLWMPKAEYIEWNSADGTTVQGWLVRPRQENINESPPLLTMVHGGPGHDINNKFQQYLVQWPYPVQIFAAKGYAVFIPNFRGTDSFGKDFQRPTALDCEPVKDITSGIQYLVEKGLVDKDRLGIMGHSHGEWLGPHVIAEKPEFKAASFAEGVGSYLSLYGQTHGFGNLDIMEHEMVKNTTPYQDPERYVELSPAFLNSFTKTTPTLLEYGQESLAFQGLEMGKALWRHGTPHKFIIYPNAGHAIRRPATQVESMNRNLNWFQQWIPTDPTKSESSN